MFTLKRWSDRQKIDRSASATRLLNDELFREAVGGTRQRYIDELLEIDAEDADGLMRVKRQLDALDDVVGHLTGIVDSGKVAEHNLKEKR